MLTALRRDDVLAVHRRAALPGMILGGIDARLFEQLLVEVAIGAFERAHEGALLRPALPFAVLDLVGVFLGRLVVAEPGRFVFQHSSHARSVVFAVLRRTRVPLQLPENQPAWRFAVVITGFPQGAQSNDRVYAGATPMPAATLARRRRHVTMRKPISGRTCNEVERDCRNRADCGCGSAARRAPHGGGARWRLACLRRPTRKARRILRGQIDRPADRL